MNNCPTVSIMIPNYNYSNYLGQCIESAINQTFDDIEILILDNSSTDSSMTVAKGYMTDKRVKICRNQFNILNRSYNILADMATGKYMLLLCSDDYILPDFIEWAIDILERNPNVGYVHGEKDFVTEDGQLQYWDPFYKCSFIAPGIEAMPVYMMTTVAHPSQGVFRRSIFQKIRGYDKEIDHMNADRTLWFYMSSISDAAYIKEKCCRIRIGSTTQTSITQRNFQHPILSHLTIKDFVRYAKEKNIPKVYNREEEALKKLADEFVLYSIEALLENNKCLAEKYLSYAKIVSREVCKSEKYCRLINAMHYNNNTENLFSLIQNPERKKREYNPPEKYRELIRGIDYGKAY